MKKCAIVTPGFLPVPAVRGGGVEQLITTLVDSNEKEQKLDIDIYTIYDSELDKLSYNNTNIIKFKIGIISKIIERILYLIFKMLKIHSIPRKYDKMVVKAISERKYDYIIVENSMYLYKKIFDYSSYKAKFIFHLHNDFGNFDKPLILAKYISKTAYKVLTVSDFLTNKFNDLTNSTVAQSFYNCVSLKDFKKIKISKNNVRKKFNIENDDIVFLFCGRFHPEKGSLELIKAFLSLKNKKAKLLLLGTGTGKKIGPFTFHNNYEKEIYRLGKNKDIIFAGYVGRKEISSYYSASDVVVIPSMCEEAFGLVAIEAMASKKALIISDRGGLPEIINNEVSKYVNKDNMIDDLENSMRYYLENPSVIRQNGQAGYEILKSKIDYNEDNYYTNFLKKIN